MKDHFRQSMAWLHTWAGLVLGWLLFFIFVTGTAGYFDTEIDRWMQPELPAVGAPPAAGQVVGVALARLRERAPAAERWFISLPGERNDPYLRILWQNPKAADGTRPAIGDEQLDSASGRPLDARATGGGQFLYRLHWRLHYLPTAISEWIVGLATMFMLVAMITGIIVHKKIFTDFFTFRPGKGQRSWLDAHNVLSVVSLPFQLMITYSGLVFLAFTYMPLIVAAYYGPGEAGRQTFDTELFDRGTPIERAGIPAPLAPLGPLLLEAQARWGEARVRGVDIRHPGDANARVLLRRVLDTPLRSEVLVFDGVSGALLEIQPAVPSTARAVHDVLLDLHEGLYAAPLLRALYVLSGLLGAAMVATGLVLWAIKRRQRVEKAGGVPHAGLRLVERLNVGTVAGLPIGIAAYFWANRLLPLEMAERAAWEGHVLFIVWALMLGHAAWRPPVRAWSEQLWIAAGAFGLLPLLNALTTGRHLAHSLPAADWVFAGFDLAMLGFGIVFALAAHRLARGSVKDPCAAPHSPPSPPPPALGPEAGGGRS